MPQCPCCGAPVEIGVPTCPDCGLALGGLDEPDSGGEPVFGELSWPDGEDGTSERAVLLTSAKNPTECALTQALLRSCGIPSFTQTPLQNQFTTVLFGGPILGADLYVPESRLAEARNLLDNGG